MADTTISGIATSVTTLAAADLFETEQSSTTKKITAAKLAEFVAQAKGADVASAGTLVLGAGNFFHITGTTGITDIDFTDTWDGRWAFLVFDGILTLTHNATTLKLPGSANLVTAAGDRAIVVVDSGDNVIMLHYERALGGEVSNPFNQSTAAQNSITAATHTYLTGSNIAIPQGRVVVGTRLHWRFSLSKTAVGTASSSFFVLVGTNGSTADTVRLTFALGVGTAAVDQAQIWIDLVCRTAGASSVWQGVLTVAKTAAATAGIIATPGAVIPITSASFDVTGAGVIFGVSVTSGSTVVFSVQQMDAESANL